MIQGTASDVGKSVMVAGLCRVLARQFPVVPFKPQNMALNSAVTEDGGEIGRAQALQALAAGVQPHTDMNPVLIKPTSDVGAQIIIQGRALDAMEAKAFHAFKPKAMAAVLDSYQRLSARYPMVLVEGAGSPAEINLREGDIANMGFAEAVDCPVILVGDIDRGGVFASLVGTLELLSESERDRVIGFVINRFRGDIGLLHSGLDWLAEKTGKPVFGVIDYLPNLFLDAEDAIETQQVLSTDAATLKVVVPVHQRLSNHTDFDPFRVHPQVNLTFVSVDQPMPACDLVILPGSKEVRGDCSRLIAQGWDQKIRRHLRYGGKVMGICGGYQMLGTQITDPEGIEGRVGQQPGLGLIPMHTELKAHKILRRGKGQIGWLAGKPAALEGYEIHCGVSRFKAEWLGNDSVCDGSAEGSKKALEVQPFCQFEGQAEGYVSPDRQIIGTYCHGVFDHPESLAALLQWAGLHTETTTDLREIRNQQLDRLADALTERLDWVQLNASLDHFYASKACEVGSDILTQTTRTQTTRTQTPDIEKSSKQIVNPDNSTQQKKMESMT